MFLKLRLRQPLQSPGKRRAKLLTILSGFVLGWRLPGHWDETDRQNRLLVDFGPMLSQQVKLLIARSTHRDNHPAAILQLIDKRLGDMLRGTGNNDGVEWRMLRPAFVTIAREHFHVKKSKPSEICLGAIAPRASRLFQLVVGGKAGWTDCAEVEIKHSLRELV